jgi:ubiquinone/menaquinone biosynthesis C-methylase UbiE
MHKNSYNQGVCNRTLARGSEMSRYHIEKRKWDEKAAALLAKRRNWVHSETYDAIFAERNTLRPVYKYFTGIDEPGIIVLDYGCGSGWSALLLATKAEQVKAFDISEGSIRNLYRSIEYNMMDNLEAQVANGEELPYGNDEFDYVFGYGILHHLTLNKCLPEIARVLKPGGRAAFCEPLAHNPLINLYRYIKHHRVERHLGTDRPLKYSDIPTFQKYFPKVQFRESSFFRDRYSSLISLDRVFLKIPLIRRYVCYVTILLENSVS